jgi:hypothetical protein
MITDALLEHEGVDPTNERARPLAWVSVHRPEMYVAGAPAQAPHYRFICQVPEGQYNDERRAAVTAAMTQAVVEAEDGSWPHPERRRVRLHTLARRHGVPYTAVRVACDHLLRWGATSMAA